ncbi:MAG TPA: AAA family ATPase [Vicinamibacterales bacterium]
MEEHSDGTSAASPGARLDSWKAIAAYLGRHVTTVRRWEKQEGLPVHRHVHAKLGSIHAFTTEVDAWFDSRRTTEMETRAPATAEAQPAPERLPPPPELSGLPPAGSIAFAGREAETGLLRDAWRLASGGQQQIVLIGGEPGIGKTRLAFEFARSVGERATVLVGRCDRESLEPFAPFVAILRWLVRETPPATLKRRLSGIEAAADLAHMIPEIAGRVYLGRRPASGTLEHRRYRMLEACSELLVATSRSGPILLALEDVHWADPGSQLFLRHLVRSTRDAALCIVLTFRDTDPDTAAQSREVIDDLRREHSATLIPLQPLAEVHVAQMIQSRIGREPPSRLTAFVLEHTEGNPLFVTELLQHLDETGGLARFERAQATVGADEFSIPGSVRALIGRRLRRMSAATQTLLTRAAVIGRQFRLSVIEALGDFSEDAVLDAMDEAVAAGLIGEEPGAPGSFSFAHTLIRETLYGGITAARRVRLHYRIGLTLERQFPDAATAPLAELAHHFSQAASYRSPEKALHYALGAGDRAAASLAPEEAARCYGTALRMLDLLPPGTGHRDADRVDLHRKLGRSLFAAGHWRLAKSAFESALSLVDPQESERRCELLVRLAETAFWAADVAAVRDYARDAHLIADGLGRADLLADALAWTASAQVADGDVLGGIETDRRALACAGGIRSFGLARVPLILYWAGRVAEAADHARQAVEAARESDDAAFLLYALQHLGLSLSGLGRYEEAIAVLDEARSFGRRCGALPLLARATSVSVAPLLGVGDLRGAMARAFEARELAHRVAFEPPRVSAGIDLLLIFARLQDPGRAESLLAETDGAVQRASGWHAWKWAIRLWQARAELAAARAAWSHAARAATHVVEQSRARHRLKYEALGLATRARALHHVGSRQAVADARDAAAVARTLGDPAVLLECLIVHLEVDGSDAVEQEARRTGQRMLDALTRPALRLGFAAFLSERWPRLPGR